MMLSYWSCAVLLLSVVSPIIEGSSLHRTRRNTEFYASGYFPQSQWTDWTSCNRDCYSPDNPENFGTQMRFHTRHYENCGTDFILCGDSVVQRAQCNLVPCDGVGTNPADWSACSAGCGGGERFLAGTDVSIACNSHACSETPAECGNARIYFVLDSSASLGTLGWLKVKQFTMDVIQSLGMPVDHFGVLYFSTGVAEGVEVDTYTDIDQLLDTIWNMEHMAGVTNTADAIKLMRNVFTASYFSTIPADTQKVGIVITDGYSNVFPDNTTVQAEEARNDGITIFSVGIGSEDNLDMNELMGIASRPVEEHFYHIGTLQELPDFVTRLANSICNASLAEVCAEWTEFSECDADCGSGFKHRRQSCERVNQLTGAVVDTIHLMESAVCQSDAGCGEEEEEEEEVGEFSVDCSVCSSLPDGVCRLANPNDCSIYYVCQSIGLGQYIHHQMGCPPTTCWNQEQQICDHRQQEENTDENTVEIISVDCATCDFSEEGLGYLADPQNCQQFYQCERRENGGYRHHVRACPRSLYWSQELLTCTTHRPEGCAEAEGPSAPQDEYQGGQGDFACPLSEDPSNYGRFFGADGSSHACRPGLVFSPTTCTCDRPTSSRPLPQDVIQEDLCLHLHFLFDQGVSDASGVYASTTGNSAAVSTLQPGIMGNAATFDGSGGLAVPYLNNWFASSSLRSFTLALWVRSRGDGVQGLLNNGNCQNDPSVTLRVQDGQLSAAVDTTQTELLVQTDSVPLEYDVWTHVALRYGSNQLELYKNGNLVSSVQLEGSIENRHCPLHIGSEIDGDSRIFFTGDIDELRVYRCALAVEEIEQLVSSGSNTPIA